VRTAKAFAIAFALSLVTFLCADADCLPRKIAPGQFLNSPTSWNKTDSGPILDGFLDLNIDGAPVPIVHGVDLSKYNNLILYSVAKACGGDFAIVQMDTGFSAHLEQLRKVSLKVIPYGYLSVVDASGHDYKKYPAQFADLDQAAMDALKTKARAIGEAKADDFIFQYEKQVPDEIRAVDIAGLQGRFVVVDVEEVFAPGSYPETQRANYGRFYGSLLAGWVARVQQKLPDVIIIFYTFPDVYASYLQYADPAENAVIHGMPIWLASTGADGGDFDLTCKNVRCKNLQRLCLSTSGGNRCIIHQYSHRATFPVGQVPKINPPRHIDVDRLFYVKQVKDQAGIQFVRQ
jgi:hypothetical protein